MSRKWQNSEEIIKSASPNFSEMLRPDTEARNGCRAPLPGELFHNKNLAGTFRELANQGKKGFYEGRIAEEIVKVVQSFGGNITLEDLKHHGEVGTEEVDPVSLKFNGQGISKHGSPLECFESTPFRLLTIANRGTH